MAAKIVQTTDFVAKYAISQNSFSESDLQSFIDKYELQYLYDLLGVDLTTAFLADITTPFTSPSTPIYATIFNPLATDEATFCHKQLRSNGIKEMLIGFIYWEFVRMQKVQTTLVGSIVQSAETSREADWSETNLFVNYNSSVKTYQAIQYYISKNKTDYPDYNGLQKMLANPYGL